MIVINRQIALRKHGKRKSLVRFLVELRKTIEQALLGAASLCWELCVGQKRRPRKAPGKKALLLFFDQTLGFSNNGDGGSGSGSSPPFRARCSSGLHSLLA